MITQAQWKVEVSVSFVVKQTSDKFQAASMADPQEVEHKAN